MQWHSPGNAGGQLLEPTQKGGMRKLDYNRRDRAEFERRYVVDCIKSVPRAH